VPPAKAGSTQKGRPTQPLRAGLHSGRYAASVVARFAGCGIAKESL